MIHLIIVWVVAPAIFWIIMFKLGDLVGGIIMIFLGVSGGVIDILHNEPFLITRLTDAVIAIVGVLMIRDWWNKKGRKKYAEKLAGYKARAIMLKLRTAMGNL